MLTSPKGELNHDEDEDEDEGEEMLQAAGDRVLLLPSAAKTSSDNVKPVPKRGKSSRARSSPSSSMKASASGYPRAVWFIVGNEFCERFSYYGMKAILSLYIRNNLGFGEDSATVMYHAFSLYCYFTPFVGAWLADQVMGKYRTIFWLSMVYAAGQILITLGSTPSPVFPPFAFSVLGLSLIALGTGGIKPCVSAFGGDQFSLPEQESQLRSFFSVFYFSINAGSLLSTFVTPVLRQDVACFGEESCFPLAFGVPAALMLTSTAVLLAGRKLYVLKRPQGDVISSVVGSIWCAASQKLKRTPRPSSPSTNRRFRRHWLDAAVSEGGYDPKLVEDVKVLLGVLWLFLPMPVFWALFEQQGSRWTFQATRMDGRIGDAFTIKPDQMQLVNPMFILLLIPLFGSYVYPALARMNLLVRPLQRMVVGCVLCALAFVVSGLLELKLQETTYEHVPKPGEAHLHFMNALNCSVRSTLLGSRSPLEGKGEIFSRPRFSHVFRGEAPSSPHTLKVDLGDDCHTLHSELNFDIALAANKVSGAVLRLDDKSREFELVQLSHFEEPKKNGNGLARIRFVTSGVAGQDISLESNDAASSSAVQLSTGGDDGPRESEYVNLKPGKYRLKVGNAEAGVLQLGQGGVRTAYLSKTSKDLSVSAFVLTPDNSVHMLWLVPQYLVITTGEVLASVTGLEFSYSQAPESMKSVLQAAWLMTSAFGNLIVILVAESRLFASQAREFFMFSLLMLLDAILLSCLASKYQYSDFSKRTEEGDRASKEVEDKDRTDEETWIF